MKQPVRKSSTREEIMSLLKTNGAMSVAQLAKQLEMTEMGVRRHLYAMQQEHMLDTEMVRQQMGRPLQMYRLSDTGDEQFPKQYHQLILDLLQEMESWQDENSVHRLFEGRRQSMLEKYVPLVQGKNLEERVEALGHIQDSNGYMVETEKADDGSWLLHEYNCPIAQVAQHYKEPCACELALFQDLLDGDVERTECLAERGQRCTYKIRPRTNQ
ncbi:helix-turn-helix transcriptional regulator [Paenibacillus alvei]|uniref:helix-turn-helix transcriptional regulator n=1 Tax=Paenibacillus alvei TaxID=44250 RepID=UPI0018CDCCC6|nr:metalloregulator ArsR/SmtB family transcription factor [Paenibacillus alvei]MBG9735834.1 transcriptional regulator [Paenibacillus alvei]MBG9745977.1 transcriptional regulator [Paenibacillus alvei]MCY9582781.1 transcriptional regulator [Paenibacillus alvei]MCY9587780.1 transcriptional regulator [Paenibacillus alvei]